MISKTFRCKHCKKYYHKNPQLKGTQKYCGSRSCQQARKNRWEREKIKSDCDYHDNRKDQKTRWRSEYPAHEYQHQYRELHPGYVKENLKKQQLRNRKRTSYTTVEKIVKTDTLNSKNLVTRGLYVLYPYKNESGKKIVKTDALIVQLAGIQDDAAVFWNKPT